MAVASATSPDRVLTGILLMLGFCLIAPWIDVAAKLAAAWVSSGMITLARFAVQGALMGAVMGPMGLTARLRRGLWGLVALRAAVAVVATFAFVAAIAVMPLADAMAIVYVQPFMVLLLGWALMGEAVGPRRLAAAGAGFAGALLVIQPNFAAFGAVALLPLVTAGCFAVYVLVTRHLRGMHPVAMQFHTAWMAVAMTLPFLLAAGNAAGWTPALLETALPWQAWVCLLGVGVAASVSHLSMTYALRFAPSATLAPLGYLEIPVVAVLGYLVFDDLPGPMAWAGILVIAGAGLYVIHRERATARDGARPVSLPPAAP
jgi:drug/metabolite transporter (DMT)-like permease